MKDIFSGEEIAPKGSKGLPLDINSTPNNSEITTESINSIHPEEGNHDPFSLGLDQQQYHAGFWETAGAALHQTSEVYNVNEFAQRHSNNPLDDIVDPNWKPTSDPSMLAGVDSKYQSYMMGATSKKDQLYRYSNVIDYQKRDSIVENGSFLGGLLGGFAGMTPPFSPSTLIPIAGQIKYARYGKTLINSIARSLPGVALSSVAHEATLNATKASGNLEDFVVNSFADTLFGAAFFGGVSVAGRAIDSAALWDMRKTILPQYHGIDFKPKVNEKGEINGYQAVDSTGSLSAAAVSYAQDIANSTFAKTGLFKIPYVGQGFINTFSVLSPLMRMMNSPYKVVRAITDRAANHSFITEGILAGKPAPQKFENEMDKVRGEMRVFSAQMTGLHLVRNGMDISTKTRARIQSTSYLKELKSKVSPENYTSVEQFHSEIDEAVRSGESSPHAAVNEAANMIRTKLDDTYKAWRKAYDLPDTWLPPKTSQEYLMRVYNTPLMNLKGNDWDKVVSKWFKDADATIDSHMQPIRDAQTIIDEHKEKHSILVDTPNVSNKQIKDSAEQLLALKANKKAMEENLQNELRTNDDLKLHVDDHSALSADEAKQIQELTKRQRIIEKEITEHEKKISAVKKQAKARESAALKSKTVKTARGNKRKSAIGEQLLPDLEDHARKLAIELDEEMQKLQEKMHNGEIPRNLWNETPGSMVRTLKDPSDRLKFRDTFESDFHRQTAARAHYNTIMNTTPEQMTEHVMGHFTGGIKGSPLKSRTLLLPDKVISQFLDKNVVSNVMNYKYFLSRRTFMKQIFQDVSIDGGFEPLIKQLSDEHQFIHGNLSENLARISEKKTKLEEKIANASDSDKEKLNRDNQKLDNEKKNVEKQLGKESKNLETAKEQLKILHDKMMGRRVFGKNATKYSHMIMSYTSAIKLGFVPFMQITDLAANVLQHGMWPFIRDGIVPAIESLGGILKTKDSEALRRSAPHVNLAAQDTLTGYADKNFGGEAIPYFNLGSRVANGLEGLAHFSSNLSGMNYIDNGLQHITGNIAQSTFMEYAHAFKAGTLSKADSIKMLKYGVDLNEWADRFMAGFNEAGANKTKLGGYNSKFWEWSDQEASNKFGDAVFRGIKDTLLQKGMLDAPFFMDHPLGSVIMAFKGWTFASLNRYVIPAMQQPNGEKLAGITFMLAMGALVSPTRRIAAGKSPYPDDVTDGQIMYAAIQDSGFFSIFADVLADANIFTGGTLLGNLRNDRYRDRTMAGLLGPSASIANDMYSVVGAAFSNQMNQNDVNKMMRLIPFTQLTEFRGLSNKFVENMDIPKTRAQAKRLNEAEG